MEGNEQQLTERQRYWLEQIRACEGSGTSLTAYAAAHGLEVRSMYTAKKVLIRKGALPRRSAQAFARAQASASTGGEWRVELTNGAAVGFSGAVDAQTLSIVLNAVARL
jgi:hypothetical protein